MTLSQSLQDILPGRRHTRALGRGKTPPPRGGTIATGEWPSLRDWESLFAVPWQETGQQAGEIEGKASPSDQLPRVEDVLSPSLGLQLSLLKEALGLTSAILIWAPQAGDACTVMSRVSNREEDIVAGPYKPKEGLLGALTQGHEEIAVHEVRADYPRLPYYQDNRDVGSIFTLRINPTVEGHGTGDGCAYLFGDRVERSPWQEREKRIFRLTANKLGMEIAQWRLLLDEMKQCCRLQRLCDGLRELNSALGMTSVSEAALKAVYDMMLPDFLAVSVVDGPIHRITAVMGSDTDLYLGREFPLHEGLVGQVLKSKTALPAGGSYPRPAPVFSNADTIDAFQSLLILPLASEKGNPLGALTIAYRQAGIFGQGRYRELVELFSAQIAVKIDLARAHEAISHQATTDGLTGLANRRTFQRGFMMMLERAARSVHPLCLILADIDHFKKINDTYGHPFGDEVLRQVSARIGAAVRRVDLAARYGGEEFAIILEDSDVRGGGLFAERLRGQIEKMTIHHGRDKVPVTMSFGLAEGIRGESQAALLARADHALYQAKKAGRNRISVANVA